MQDLKFHPAFNCCLIGNQPTDPPFDCTCAMIRPSFFATVSPPSPTLFSSSLPPPPPPSSSTSTSPSPAWFHCDSKCIVMRGNSQRWSSHLPTTWLSSFYGGGDGDDDDDGGGHGDDDDYADGVEEVDDD